MSTKVTKKSEQERKADMALWLIEHMEEVLGKNTTDKKLYVDDDSINYLLSLVKKDMAVK